MRTAGTSRLPPLNAINAFDVAARYLSFVRAADELHVTPSAVSHRIRALEDFLGVALFRRLSRQIELTEAGTRYLKAVRDGLDVIAAATGTVRRQRRVKRLTISVAPAFAFRLIRGLPDFYRRHPGVELSVISSARFADFARAEADVAVRYGSGPWPGLVSHYLLGNELLPICSPGLLAKGAPLTRPADLKHFTLLQVLKRADDWRLWLEQEGVRDVDPERGPAFETTAMAVEAAMNDLGVVLAERESVEQALRDGRLVAPFAATLRTQKGYHLVYPRRRRKDKILALFRDWALAFFAAASEPRRQASGRERTRMRRGGKGAARSGALNGPA